MSQTMLLVLYIGKFLAKSSSFPKLELSHKFSVVQNGQVSRTFPFQQNIYVWLNINNTLNIIETFLLMKNNLNTYLLQ